MNSKLIREDTIDELIVIPDECGDSLWDAVLKQELYACEIRPAVKNTPLSNRIDAVQVCDATKAE